MLGGTTFLKVKVRSLAEEARIIHSMESKTHNKYLRGALYAHRKTMVAKEERDSLIAYACLRFIPYSAVEGFSNTEPDWDNVKRLIKKFGDWKNEEHYNQWVIDARSWWTAIHTVSPIVEEITPEYIVRTLANCNL